MSKPPARLSPLSKYIAHSEPLAHAEQLWTAQLQLRQALPPFLQGTRIANYHPQTGSLALQVDNAALAAKLRQMASRVKKALVSMGWKCSEIHIRIQPNTLPLAENCGAAQKPLSAGARQALAGCAAALPCGSPAKAALEHLLAHAA